MSNSEKHKKKPWIFADREEIKDENENKRERDKEIDKSCQQGPVAQ